MITITLQDITICMVCKMMIITYVLWMVMMIITLQDREVLATVGSLQHPSQGKPEVWLDVKGDE